MLGPGRYLLGVAELALLVGLRLAGGQPRSGTSAAALRGRAGGARHRHDRAGALALGRGGARDGFVVQAGAVSGWGGGRRSGDRLGRRAGRTSWWGFFLALGPSSPTGFGSKRGSNLRLRSFRAAEEAPPRRHSGRGLRSPHSDRVGDRGGGGGAFRRRGEDATVDGDDRVRFDLVPRAVRGGVLSDAGTRWICTSSRRSSWPGSIPRTGKSSMRWGCWRSGGT